MKGLPPKHVTPKEIFYRTGKCTVCNHVGAFFSPGNFTDWGGEGVKEEKKRGTKVTYNTDPPERRSLCSWPCFQPSWPACILACTGSVSSDTGSETQEGQAS